LKVGALPEAGIQDDLRASELREWQLWFLTLGLLVLFGSGAVAGFYFLLDDRVGDGASRQAATKLLGALSLLIFLFCAYIVHVRTTVSRVKLFLNEMNGMATGNLEIHECLGAIADGMARTYRAPFARILVVRTNDPAVEIVSTHVSGARAAQPADGTSHAFEDLPVLRSTVESFRPVALPSGELAALPPGSVERTVLTGGVGGVENLLILPLRTRTRTVGLVILGLRNRPFRQEVPHRILSTAHTLSRHAGHVVEEVIRKREAIRDPLTDLYNRRHFKERIVQEIERASRERSSLAILLCDLDHFKAVNDTHGHAHGDQVLKAVAVAIRAATRGTDLHFRWGGDEIVVILSKTSTEGVLIAAERIRSSIRVYAESERLRLDASIGVALYPQHGTDEDELLRAADLAMYVAKKSGDHVRVGVDEYAIDERCVRFVYQPIVDVASGAVLGHEVFARDPGGSLSPLELFKKYHAVGQLGRLKRVIFEMQIEQSRAAGVERLFLNADIDFLNRTEPVPLPQGLRAVVEISELDANPKAEDRVAAVERWRAAGYEFALDDFGAGYVSLPLLGRIRPDFVKIDRSSVVHAAESPKYRDFLRHLVRAAAEFTTGGIVAEGIERETELEVALELGAGYAQGYLLGRPEEKSRV
jgi:diguanylate cyclase (GGDEF)-like protein